MRVPSVTALVVLLALSGCLRSDDAPREDAGTDWMVTPPPGDAARQPAPDARPEPVVAPVGAPTPDPLRLACPDGGEDPFHDCASRFGLPGQDQGEPAVAVDPSDPERRLLAFQQKTVGDDGPWPMQFHRSDDGGATWTRLTDPWPVQDPHADPAVAFLPDGSLFASSIAVGASAGGTLAPDVWVARSGDDGASWDAQRITRDGDNDQPKLAVGDDGTLVLLWQHGTPPSTSEERVSAVVSHDHGRTWSEEMHLVESCAYPSHPILHGGGFGFACTLRGGDCRVPWYHADTAGGPAVAVGCIRQEALGTNWVARLGDHLAATHLGHNATLLTSRDGGRTWNDHGSIRDLVPGLDPTHGAAFRIATDGAGWHLLMGSLDAFADPAGVGRFGVSHVSLTLALESRVDVLWDGAFGVAVHKGEYYDVAAGPAGGLVAWVDGEHRVRTAPLVP